MSEKKIVYAACLQAHSPAETMQNSSVFTPTAQKIADRLAAYLGPHTARTAVKTFCLKALSRGPETLSPADVPQLLQSLRPMLKTFVGKARCELVLDAIAKETGP